MRQMHTGVALLHFIFEIHPSFLSTSVKECESQRGKVI